MSISNNIGHDNSLKDTPFRNNLTEILIAYLEWQRTGAITPILRDNTNPVENLECPLQYWLMAPEKLTIERFDSFFYSLELGSVYDYLDSMERKKRIKLLKGQQLSLRKKLTAEQKNEMREDEQLYKYIEISDVTQYGLITTYVEDVFSGLPTRGEYQVQQGDILLALNNSSRGTVVLVPEEFDGAICTSGFLVIVPQSVEESLLLWFVLRSEVCRKQIYYLAQTASQPELKIDAWNKYFSIPLPKGKARQIALEKAREFYGYVAKLSDLNNYRYDL